MELYALRDVSTPDPNLQEVDIYLLEGIIQKGKGCTRLLRASSSELDEPLAIKIFPKSNEGQSSPGFTNEEGLVSKLSHPNLVKYFSFYKDALIKGRNDDLNQYSAIMMEYVPAGDLFNLISNGSLSEKLARTLFKQMLSVVEYLHGQNIAHTDLKLGNFLVTDNGIKLIGFDACKSVQKSANVSLPAGTSGYRPPEFIKGGYQDLKAADLYSLGIILFMMVTGTPPYTELEENKTYRFDKYYDALRKDVQKFWKVHEHYRSDDNREAFSKEFKQLIEGLLAEKPQDRLKLEEVKRSLWFKGETCSKEELQRSLNRQC